MKKADMQAVLEQIATLAGNGAANGETHSEGRSDEVQPARTRRGHRPRREAGGLDVLERKDERQLLLATKSSVHTFGRGAKCHTDKRGHATPGGRSPAEIVLDASEGFIPLWQHGTTLRWQFNEASLEPFLYPEDLKEYVRERMRAAVLAWGDAAPVGFTERGDAWDFEIVVRAADDCDANGCTLASAFFPDAGRHQLVIYPKMFEQDQDEQVETLVHELGHVFGLRHFFADVHESTWPSEIFGEHRAFSIMNYGWRSVLTETDRADLTRLYETVWSGELTNVNGTPIRLVKPYHASGEVVMPNCESLRAAAVADRRD